MSKEDRYITVVEAANLLGVHPNTIYNWIAEGRLPHIQVGVNKKILIRHSTITNMEKNI